jgi:hypothetical protein
MSIERQGLHIHSDLEFSTTRNLSKNKILSFLRHSLPEVAKQLVKEALSQRIDLTNICENKISSEIHRLLNDKLREANSDYAFTFREMSSPDILIYASPYIAFSEILFVIEAKRLRSKSSNDYVKTGINRFKTEEHGKSHDIAAMLGYVQENDFSHWYDKVNFWIIALISDTSDTPKWTTEEQINKIEVTEIGEYQSTHCRITEEPITLHHFWIDLCKHAPTIIVN